jgi:hypothetical protein
VIFLSNDPLDVFQKDGLDYPGQHLMSQVEKPNQNQKIDPRNPIEHFLIMKVNLPKLVQV